MSTSGPDEHATDPWGNPIAPPTSPASGGPSSGGAGGAGPSWWGTSDPDATAGASGTGGPSSGGRGLAISGIVAGAFGLIGCGVILGPLAIVLGVLGRRRIQEAGEPGERLGLAAIVLGAIVLVFNVVVLAYLFTHPDALEGAT